MPVGCVATAAVGAVTRGSRAEARRANAHVRRVRRTDWSTDIDRRVSIIGRNLNRRNNNGLFSRHRPLFYANELTHPTGAYKAPDGKPEVTG